MRRKLDAYMTPAWAVRELLKHVIVRGTVFEPCAGDGSITNVIAEIPGRPRRIITNDIDRQRLTDRHGDAREQAVWKDVTSHWPIDWVITNPTWSKDDPLRILQHATWHAKVGVALLLRLSFLEPTDTRYPRGPFLHRHPPSRLIVLPRHSFTGDGKSDSVTAAWMVWEAGLPGMQIVCAYGADRISTKR